MAEYENRFTELARYTPLILTNEPMRIGQFSEGLRPDIRTKICCASIPNYAELVNMSLRADEDGESVSDTYANGPKASVGIAETTIPRQEAAFKFTPQANGSIDPVKAIKSLVRLL